MFLANWFCARTLPLYLHSDHSDLCGVESRIGSRLTTLSLKTTAELLVSPFLFHTVSFKLGGLKNLGHKSWVWPRLDSDLETFFFLCFRNAATVHGFLLGSSESFVSMGGLLQAEAELWLKLSSANMLASSQ